MRKPDTRLLATCQHQCSEEEEAMETPNRMCTPQKTSVAHSIRSSRVAWLAVCTASLLVIAGCSTGNNSSTKPVVGSISFTDANGTPLKTAPTSLTVSQGTYLDATLTSDPRLLGADWSVACGSALPPGTPLPPGQVQDQSCGTFTPTHTMSGPPPDYVASGAGYVAFYTAPPVPPKEGVVTLYASATADHTRLASVTLSINGLPISVGFAPAPPATMGTNASAQLRAVLNNDATNAGVTWSLLCASTACGSIGPVQTASGVATTYSAPSVIPNGGTVKITATSIADPTRAVSATVQIVPISISVTPATLSVATAGTGSLAAIITNDGSNRGVDWSVSCTNTMSAGKCGSITSHTASGGTATYTAPSIADIAIDNTILITGTSTTDPSQSATATATIVKGDFLAGNVLSARQPVNNAQVTLYAAVTGETALNTVANDRNASAITTATTDRDGNFSIPYGYVCPTPDARMYLVTSGGNAGGGINSNLALMAALGACSTLDASRFVVNEATTAAAVYSLSAFIADPQHIGSSSVLPAGMSTAFATAHDLVDTTTGVARTRTVAGTGIVPQQKLNALADLVNACAKTGGSAQGDGSVCDQLFRATNPGTTPATQASNTIQALLDLSRNANPNSFAALYRLTQSTSAFGPSISAEPNDWTLPVQFSGEQGGASPKILTTNSTSCSVDAAGNVWIRGEGDAATEFVGATSCVEVLKTRAPVVAGSGSAQ